MSTAVPVVPTQVGTAVGMMPDEIPACAEMTDAMPDEIPACAGMTDAVLNEIPACAGMTN